jgi:hypothetical protein
MDKSIIEYIGPHETYSMIDLHKRCVKDVQEIDV